MKAGILTYHRTVNEGSVLQLYCTHKLLDRLGWSSEVVDYRYVPKELLELQKIVSLRRCKVRYDQLKKHQDLRRFVQEHIQKGPVNWSVTGAYAQEIQDRYDVVVSGSDTVWVVSSNKLNRPPFPNIYYQAEFDSVKKISVAASMDGTPIEALTPPVLRQIRNSLSDFSYITYRDCFTARVLADAGVESPVQYMPDPTILYDFRELCQPVDVADKYAVLAISEPKIAAPYARVLNQLGYQVFSTLTDIEDGVRKIKGLSLRKKLFLFAHSSLTITDRFHGLVPHLVMNKSPVIFYERNTYSPGLSKGADLLHRLDSEHAYTRSLLRGADIQQVMERFDPVLVADRLGKLRQTGLETFENMIRTVNGAK